MLRLDATGRPEALAGASTHKCAVSTKFESLEDWLVASGCFDHVVVLNQRTNGYCEFRTNGNEYQSLSILSVLSPLFASAGMSLFVSTRLLIFPVLRSRV